MSRGAFASCSSGSRQMRMGREVLEALAGPLGRVPHTLVRAIEKLFRSPHSFRDVEDLAFAAGMNRRTLDRWLDKSGLASARTLLLAARLLRAYHFLRDPRSRLEEVTTKVGYASSRSFARQVRAATGLTPSALRLRTGPEQFMTQMTMLLRRQTAERSEE